MTNQPRALVIRMTLLLLLLAAQAPAQTIIPHLTAQDPDWADYLLADNTGATEASFRYTLYRDGAAAHTATVNVGAHQTEVVAIGQAAPDASLGTVTTLAGELLYRVGYLRQGGGAAEFPASETTSPTLLLSFSDYADFVTWKGMAVANPGPAQTRVTLAAYGNSGLLGTTSLDIAPMNRTVGVVETYFPGLAASDVQRIVATTANTQSPQNLSGIAISGSADNARLLFTPGRAAPAPELTPSLAGVRFWAYQIQNLSEDGAVDALAASAYDLLVLEPTRTDFSDVGPDAERHFDTASMVSRLKASTGADGQTRKLVLAYIDIGQAEDWRWYWTWSKDWQSGEAKPADWPGYIAVVDPDGWEGNYVVNYWDATWKDIVLYGQHTGTHPDRDYVSIVDEVIRDGFDGVYLDWVEAFENEEVIAAATDAGVDPVAEMLAFIDEIRTYAASRTDHFFIIQQNGSALALQNASAPAHVDGIAQEGTWYEGQATDDWADAQGYDEAVDPILTAEYLHNLGLYQTAGVPVFACDYALESAATAYTNAQANGYVGYVTRRSLSKLTTTPPPGLP